MRRFLFSMTPGTSKPAVITWNLTAQWFIPQPHGMGSERVAVIRKFTLTQRCHVVTWFDIKLCSSSKTYFPAMLCSFYIKPGNFTYNVILRRVRVTTVAVGKQCLTYSECVSVTLVIHSAKRMRLFYCHPWSARLYHIFPHYLINGTIFGKRLLNIKCVLIFSTTFVWNISHSKKNI